MWSGAPCARTMMFGGPGWQVGTHWPMILHTPAESANQVAGGSHLVSVIANTQVVPLVYNLGQTGRG